MYSAAAVAAVCLTVAQNVQQVRRIAAHGTAGVSLGTWSMASVSLVGWVAWAFSQHVWPSFVTSSLCAPLAWYVTAQVAVATGNHAKVLPACVLGSAALAVTVTTVPAAAVAFAVIGPLSNVPQLLRTVRGGDLVGISLAGWLYATVAQSLWVVAGAYQKELAVWAGAGLSAVQAAAITALLVRRAAVRA